MATKRLRRMRNQTKKRKHEKKGGSVQCIYDKSSKKLHITIERVMLDENLSVIRTACEKAIKESSPEKSKQAYVVKSAKKSSPGLQRATIVRGFPTSESLTDDRGILDGRREVDDK
jgi:hypothetical protein